MKQLLIVMIGVGCVSFVINADTVTWNAGSGDVNTAANWSPAQVPGYTDVAHVHIGSASMSAAFSPMALWIASAADGNVADFTQTSGTLTVGASDGLVIGFNGSTYGRYFMKGGSLSIPGGQPQFGGYGYGLLR
ncbi:MAG: hypothetical protein K6G91_05010, partial [Kiritimatiellae bacterium]|nr:hypothetical protein [Kiritimatiellia bacterium]